MPQDIKWFLTLVILNKHLVNAKGNRSIEQILNDDIWEKLFDSFTNDAFVECSQKCNKNVVDKKYGIGYYTN